MNRAFLFDPLNAEGQKMQQLQIHTAKQKRGRLSNIVIMCRHCKSILHESIRQVHPKSIRQHKGQIQPMDISQFKNVQVKLESQTVLLYCNLCAQQIGDITHPGSIRLQQGNILLTCFSWQQKAREPHRQEVTVGSYSGLNISKVEGLLSRIMYLKCRRYQELMKQNEAAMNDTLRGYANFILLINIYKAEESNDHQHQSTHEASPLQSHTLKQVTTQQQPNSSRPAKEQQFIEGDVWVGPGVTIARKGVSSLHCIVEEAE